jgi:Protein of unknown function (DUF3012)
MNKVLAILNSKYFMAIVIGLSILVIIVGILMIKQANEQALIHAEKQKSQEANITLEQFELIATQAAAELKASQSTESGPPAKMDFASDATREKVANMTNKNPEQGTEDWCELMMVKPDAEWTKEEQGIFAKHCL